MLASGRTANLPDHQDARILSVKSAKAFHNDARRLAWAAVLELLRFVQKVAKSCLNVGLAARVTAPGFQCEARAFRRFLAESVLSYAVRGEEPDRRFKEGSGQRILE